MPLNDLESRILKNIRPNFNWPSVVNGRGEGVKCMLYEKPNQTDKPIMLLSSLYSNKKNITWQWYTTTNKKMQRILYKPDSLSKHTSFVIIRPIEKNRLIIFIYKKKIPETA